MPIEAGDAHSVEDDHPVDKAAHARVITICEALGRLLGIARMLVEQDRVIDLQGLDDRVGLLCAMALDLPATRGRAARAHLATLLQQTDALMTALRHSDTG